MAGAIESVLFSFNFEKAEMERRRERLGEPINGVKPINPPNVQPKGRIKVSLETLIVDIEKETEDK